MRPDAAVFVIPSVRQPTALAWLEGVDVAAVGTAVDGIEMCAYGPRELAVADVWNTRQRIGPDAALRCILRPASPDHADAASLRAGVRALEAIGIRDVAFYNLGLLPRGRLDWIRHALAEDDGGRSPP